MVDYDTYREVMDTELKILIKMIDELEKDKENNDNQDDG